MKAANIGAMKAPTLKSLLKIAKDNLRDACERHDGRAAARIATYVDVFETEMALRTPGPKE